ncbi:MAG: phosphoribosylanthranilate isomerase [Vampirovibrionales bacterium]
MPLDNRPSLPSLPFIKVCGLQSVADVQMCLSFEPAALGVVLVPNTPRFVPNATLQRMIHASPNIPVVGVFQNASMETIIETVLATGLRHIQLHTQEAPTPWQAVKALHQALHEAVNERVSLMLVASLTALPTHASLLPYLPYIDKLLLDWPKSATGATRSPDWQSPALRDWLQGWRTQWQQACDAQGLTHFQGTLLAGKLTPQTVVDALALPVEGIDLASGVEDAVTGQKCHQRLQALWHCLGD